MERNKLNIKLKEVFDMTIFSQLLEMDEEEARKSSSTALYDFLERGKEKVGFMEIAL
jgi:osomolarity two-component system phosphorelay intermediate protein YPD1